MRAAFPYLQRGNHWFPVVDIALQGPRQRTIVVAALIDSGASFSLFRPEIAEALGITVERGTSVPLEGIGGRILGYKHRVPASIADHRFLLTVMFSREFTVSFNLLGRSNFFRQFRVTFDERARVTELER